MSLEIKRILEEIIKMNQKADYSVESSIRKLFVLCDITIMDYNNKINSMNSLNKRKSQQFNSSQTSDANRNKKFMSSFIKRNPNRNSIGSVLFNVTVAPIIPASRKSKNNTNNSVLPNTNISAYLSFINLVDSLKGYLSGVILELDTIKNYYTQVSTFLDTYQSV